MKPLIILSITVAFAAPFLYSQEAHAKTARCEISNEDGRYVGPCDFTAGKGGSFSLTLPEKAVNILYINYMEVTVKTPGVGRLAGTVDGIGKMNDWGTVRRDPKKPACWVGVWGRVCAY